MADQHCPIPSQGLPQDGQVRVTETDSLLCLPVSLRSLAGGGRHDRWTTPIHCRMPASLAPAGPGKHSPGPSPAPAPFRESGCVRSRTLPRRPGRPFSPVIAAPARFPFAPSNQPEGRRRACLSGHPFVRIPRIRCRRDAPWGDRQRFHRNPSSAIPPVRRVRPSATVAHGHIARQRIEPNSMRKSTGPCPADISKGSPKTSIPLSPVPVPTSVSGASSRLSAGSCRISSRGFRLSSRSSRRLCPENSHRISPKELNTHTTSRKTTQSLSRPAPAHRAGFEPVHMTSSTTAPRLRNPSSSSPTSTDTI